MSTHVGLSLTSYLLLHHSTTLQNHHINRMTGLNQVSSWAVNANGSIDGHGQEKAEISMDRTFKWKFPSIGQLFNIALLHRVLISPEGKQYQQRIKKNSSSTLCKASESDFGLSHNTGTTDWKTLRAWWTCVCSSSSTIVSGSTTTSSPGQSSSDSGMAHKPWRRRGHTRCVNLIHLGPVTWHANGDGSSSFSYPLLAIAC